MVAVPLLDMVILPFPALPAVAFLSAYNITASPEFFVETIGSFNLMSPDKVAISIVPVEEIPLIELSL